MAKILPKQVTINNQARKIMCVHTLKQIVKVNIKLRSVIVPKLKLNVHKTVPVGEVKHANGMILFILLL